MDIRPQDSVAAALQAVSDAEDSRGPGSAAGSEDALVLIQLSGLVQAAFARAAERHDLTPVQARLLCVLASGPRGMADLARGFCVEKAALTGLVDRAERRDLVQRIRVPGDRRAVQVALTESGRRSAAAFHADVTDNLKRLVSPLPAEERERFRAAVAAIAGSTGGSAGWTFGRGC